jgi:5'-nucleotidase
VVTVLAVNDDGVDSVGLRVLVEELSSSGFKVYVITPAYQMSGMSKTVSFYRFGRDGRIWFKKVDVNGAMGCWALNATPAESVLIALRLLLEEKPSIVVSGVNSGPNLGLEDILTSGTVGAALEAYLHGIPAIAVSLAHDGSASSRDYRIAARVASILAYSLIEGASSKPWLLNVNVPLKPQGVIVTRPALNTYRTKFKIEGEVIEVLRDSMEERYWDREYGTDVWAVLNGYISITPLNIFKVLDVDERFKFKLEDIVRRLQEDL